MLLLDKKPQYWWYLILSLCGFFSFYFALGAYPLFDNNEGLYASIAKLMLQHKEFIIPHLNCVPYIEKPPLLYWLLAGSFSIFGPTAFAARLVTATSAALTCAAIVFFAKKIKQPQIGILGALIFTSSVGVSIIARMVYFDMVFTFFLSGTLFCLFYWYETQKKSSLRLGYLFFGLAILTKGLVAIILISGSFIAFLILEKNFRRLSQAFDPLGIALFLAIVLPWHIAAIMHHKDFIKHYIIEEHFLRFLNVREPHDYYHGPVYYYLPRIMIYLLPWSLFIPLIFWRTKTTNLAEQKISRFCWCWLLIPLIFFSLSSAKANYYMIVSSPAIAMLIGMKIKDLFTNYQPKIFSIWCAGILLSIAIVLGIKCWIFPTTITIAAVIYCLIAAIIAIVITRHSNAILAIVASIIIPIAIVMISHIKVIKDTLSTAEAGEYLTTLTKNQPLYIYQDFENISALAFYSPDCFKIIDSKSNDLYYGKSLPEFKFWFVNKEELINNNLDRQIYVVVPTKKLTQFYLAMQPLKFILLKNFTKVAIVSN